MSGSHDAASPPQRVDSGPMLALVILGEVFRAKDAPKNAAKLAAGVRVDEDTMAVALSYLAQRGFVAVITPKMKRQVPASALRYVNWRRPHLLEVTPEGLAWVRRQITPFAALVLEVVLEVVHTAPAAKELAATS